MACTQDCWTGAQVRTLSQKMSEGLYRGSPCSMHLGSLSCRVRHLQQQHMGYRQPCCPCKVLELSACSRPVQRKSAPRHPGCPAKPACVRSTSDIEPCLSSASEIASTPNCCSRLCQKQAWCALPTHVVFNSNQGGHLRHDTVQAALLIGFAIPISPCCKYERAAALRDKDITCQAQVQLRLLNAGRQLGSEAAAGQIADLMEHMLDFLS